MRPGAWNKTDYQSFPVTCLPGMMSSLSGEILHGSTIHTPRFGEFLSAPFFCFGPLRRRTLASDCGQFLWVSFAARALPPLCPPARPPSEPSATAAAFFPPVVAEISVGLGAKGLPIRRHLAKGATSSPGGMKQ